MEDYLHPLKLVRNKVRGLTGILCNGSNEEIESLKVEAEGLPLDKVKFFKSHFPNNQLREANVFGINGETDHCIEKTHQNVLSDCHAISDLFQAVVNGDVHNGIFVTRATDQAGFLEKEKCYENLALAVQNVFETMTEVEKVLMVTMDSQRTLPMRKALGGTSRILHFSLEQESPSALNTWEKLEQGYNFNVTYGPEKQSEADYLAVLHHLLLPVAYEYNPDLVVICEVSENLQSGLCAHLIASLMSLAHGKVIVVAEDKRGVTSFSNNVLATLSTLMGQTLPSSLSGGKASESMCKAIVGTINSQRAYWKCFRFQGKGDIQEDSRKSHSHAEKVFSPAKENTTNADNKIFGKSVATANDVAFIYDERMLAHYSYTALHHVERPERMKSIYHRMREYGLVDRCLRIDAQMATRDQICMLHEESYLDLVARVKTDDELKPHLFNKEYDSTSCCPDTYELSLLAAGSAIKLVDAILDGETASGIAVIRPPGHHAEAGASCGFCIFNNTALAAKHAVEQRSLSRVLIVDWDIHHGNGIQRMFYEDPRVLYVSIHAFKDFPAQPETMKCNAVGIGVGTGYNINIPWSEHGMGDPEYLSAFFDIVLPVAYEFQPELVLVACGFDAARGDPLGRCKVSPEAYGHMASLLKPLANGRLGVILEGGYFLESVSYGMTMITKALLGDPLPKLRLTSIPQISAREDIRQVKEVLQPYWHCLQFPVAVSSSITKLEGNGEYITLDWCPHLDALMSMEPSPEKGVGFGRLCPECNFFMPNACCLTCYKVLCFRECNDGHSLQHYEEVGHPLAFHFGTFKVFCHRCESWVENPVLKKVTQRAHWERYGEDPYSYPELEQ